MKKFQHNYSDSDVRSLFEDAMKHGGLIFESKDLPIIMDGKTRYVRVSNRSSKNKNSRSGWYVGHLGDFPVGKFGWMHGENPSFSWSLYNHIKDQNENGVTFKELTPEEIEEQKIKKERELKRRKIQEQDEFIFSQSLTIIEWVRSLPLKDMHPYLSSKKLSIEDCQEARIYNQNNYTKKEVEEILSKYLPKYNSPRLVSKLLNYQYENIKFRGYNLIIKGMLIDATPIMFQLIFNKKNKQGKNKHFPKLLKKHKSFLPLGMQLSNKTKHVIICEGWATGKSIVKVTKGQIAVLVAWDSGNIKAVAKAIRKKIKDVKIYIASDNDHLSPPDKNAGLLSGLKTGYAVGSYLLLPPFDPNNANHEELSDWNDIELNSDFHIMDNIFRTTFKNAEYIHARYEQGNRIDGEDEVYEDFSEYSDIRYHSEDFNYFSISAIDLISKGLQNCGLTGKEKIEWIEENEAEFRKEHPNIKLVYTKTEDEQSLNQVSGALYKFINTIHFDKNFNVLTNTNAFSDVLTVLKNNQNILPNTLSLAFNAFKHLHPIMVSNAIMVKNLETVQFFSNNHQEWQHKVGKKLKEVLKEQNIKLNLGFLLTELCQSKEVVFWSGTSEEERIDMAVNQIFNSMKEVNSTEEINIKEITDQYEISKKIDEILIEYYLDPKDENQKKLNQELDYAKDNINEELNNIILNKVKHFIIFMFKKTD